MLFCVFLLYFYNPVKLFVIKVFILCIFYIFFFTSCSVLAIGEEQEDVDKFT